MLSFLPCLLPLTLLSVVTWYFCIYCTLVFLFFLFQIHVLFACGSKFRSSHHSIHVTICSDPSWTQQTQTEFAIQSTIKEHCLADMSNSWNVAGSQGPSPSALHCGTSTGGRAGIGWCPLRQGYCCDCSREELGID